MSKPKQNVVEASQAKRAEKSADREKQLQLADDLVQLNDDVADCCDMSAFLCAAFTKVLSDEEIVNQEIISGARICSNWLHKQTCNLKDDMRHVHESYTALHKNMI